MCSNTAECAIQVMAGALGSGNDRPNKFLSTALTKARIMDATIGRLKSTEVRFFSVQRTHVPRVENETYCTLPHCVVCDQDCTPCRFRFPIHPIEVVLLLGCFCAICASYLHFDNDEYCVLVSDHKVEPSRIFQNTYLTLGRRKFSLRA